MPDYIPDIVRFKPVHAQMCLMHIGGMQNQEIAEVLGYSPVRISQVLNDPKSQAFIEKKQKALQKRTVISMADKLSHLAEKSLDNLKQTVDTPVKVGSRAKSHQDHVAFKLLDRVGYGPQSTVKHDGPALTLSAEGEQRLLQALEKADRAREIYDDAEDAEFSIVPREETSDNDEQRAAS